MRAPFIRETTRTMSEENAKLRRQIYALEDELRRERQRGSYLERAYQELERANGALRLGRQG